MEQLELKYYNRQELAEIIGIDSKDKNYARKVKDTLDKWGYQFDKYSCKGLTIVKQPTTPEERLNEIFNRYYNIDIRTDIYGMACFLYMLAYDEAFQSMPWAVRAEELRSEFGVSVDERTLRNWANKLMNRDMVAKFNSDKTAWISYKVEGETFREMITGDEALEEQARTYFKKRNQYRKEYKEREVLENNREDYEKINSESWSFAMKTLWDEFHCCYYYCPSFYLNAIGEHAQEIFEIIDAIGSRQAPYVYEPKCIAAQVPESGEFVF